jgi:tripartite-type tricarboxylate transporter receptor subunit TctC
MIESFDLDRHALSFRRDARRTLSAFGKLCYNRNDATFKISGLQEQRSLKNNTGRTLEMITRRNALGLLAATPLAASPLSKAFAADYPSRPVKFVVGYPPGGATDILARLIGQRLSEKFGQQFVVENKPGAGNNIGTESVVNAEPDGYTVLLVNPANYINSTLYTNLKFNFVRDIAPIAAFQRVPNVMTVNKDVPAKTVAEFIDYVKANPGKVNMASSGNGTSVHLSGEMFMAMTGCKMQHVPYRGAALAITDMLGGQVQVIFDNMPSIIQHIRSDSLRALGVTTAQRSPQLPDVPAIGETVKDYEASALFGMGAPKNMPKDMIAKLNTEINALMKEPDMTKRLVELGGDPLVLTPEAFGKEVEAETAKWKKVVEFAGLKVE